MRQTSTTYGTELIQFRLPTYGTELIQFRLPTYGTELIQFRLPTYGEVSHVGEHVDDGDERN